MIAIEDIVQVSYTCPSQWEGSTLDGEEILIHYRWGMLRVDLDDETVFEEQLGHEFDSYIDLEEVEEILEEI